RSSALGKMEARTVWKLATLMRPRTCEAESRTASGRHRQALKARQHNALRALPAQSARSCALSARRVSPQRLFHIGHAVAKSQSACSSKALPQLSPCRVDAIRARCANDANLTRALPFHMQVKLTYLGH